MKPKTISVVTPSYNQGDFVGETIRSVLTQCGDFYIDYIIIDGGSTDHSVSIIKEYDAKFKSNPENFTKCSGIRFNWVSEKDNGQVDALKKGFRMASGDILCWLNSDDIFPSSDVLQKVVSYFNDDPGLKLLTGDGIFISKSGTTTGTHHVERINIKELLFLDYHIFQPSTFFTRDVYDETLLDETFNCAFDAKFFIGLLEKGISYRKVNDILGAFRYYEENKTISLRNQRYRESMSIARRFSRNLYFYTVSLLYRKTESLLHPVIQVKHGFKYKLFVFSRRLAYLLITGKFKR